MKNLKILYVFGFILILQGCAYYPQLTDIPLISEKGDLQVDAGITTCITANVTASYGLTDKIALQVFGSIVNGYYFQAAAGPYKKLKNGSILELYNGIGYGYGDAYNDANPGHLSGNYQVVFSQLNYGVTNRSFLNSDLGISLKTGYMHSYMKDDNYYDIYSYDPYRQVDFIRDHSILLEPTAFWRFGGKNLKFGIKAGTVLFYEFTSQNKSFPVGPLNIGMSLSYRFK